ncbi:MAG: hypothetical protein IJN50_02595 [Clostridia bacterium]|nr:hypothetical protein [Clostridia bacterium]
MNLKTRNIIVLIMIICAVLLFGTTTVNATDVSDEQNINNIIQKLNLTKNDDGDYVYVYYKELGSSVDYDNLLEDLNKTFKEQGYELRSTEQGYGGGGDLIFTVIGGGLYDVYKNDVKCSELPLQRQIKTKITIPADVNETQYIEYITNKINENKDYLGISSVSKVEKAENNFYNVSYIWDLEECDGEILVVKEEKKEIKKEDTTTGVKLESTSAILPSNVVLSVEKVTKQDTLNIVEKSLKDVSNEYVVYDITLLQDNAKIQPNGKVKISLPIPSNYDTENLSVFRVAETGEKTEYKPTVTTTDNVKYAVVETDHFSTYVLAEKQVETETVTPPVEETPKTEETPKVETNKSQKDETPKTGTVEAIYFILPVIVISALGVVLFKKH